MSKREKIVELFGLMEINDSGTQALVAQLGNMLGENLASLIGDMRERLKERVKDFDIAIYDEAFDEEEIDRLIILFSDPVHRKLASLRGDFTARVLEFIARSVEEEVTVLVAQNSTKYEQEIRFGKQKEEPGLGLTSGLN